MRVRRRREYTVTESDVQQLLYRRESETLDFKRDQYPFSKATDEQKSELLKDILAFTNAWRASPAYILIGVEEKPIPRVTGIPEQSHLSDHELQQFVNSKTSKPILFGYERVLYQGLHVGVLIIDYPQQRPIFLSKNYGSLSSAVVYLRRGSSTDEASPDEVAEMGRAEALTVATPRISLELAKPDEEERCGSEVEVQCIRLAVRSPQDQSDVEADQQKGTPRILDRAALFGWQAEGAKISRLAGFRALRFWVHNTSQVTALDVNIRLELPAVAGLEVIGETNHPRYGKYNLAAPFHHPHVQRVGDHWRVDVRLQKLQPKEEDYTGTSLLRAEHAAEIDGTAKISADNLREPITVPVHLGFTVVDRSVSYYEAQDLWQALMR